MSPIWSRRRTAKAKTQAVHVHPRFGTPARLTIGFGILIAILAALIPLGEIVKLVNIGTLFAFLLVNIGVLVLRRTRPDMPRPFRVPWSPVLPIVGCLFVVYLMTQLPLTTWVRFIVWLIVGLIIYFAYSRRHSRIRLEGSAAGPNALDPDDDSEPR